ncbi:hypothetical protein EON79_08515 [bacterium]|nr:MAG: hypothetical protein EON79_08515 [bacterium]
MTAIGERLMPASVEFPSDNQRLFVRYFTGILIDLVVLNLFDEFSDRVTIDSFSISLLAAVLFQFLLRATIAVEHAVGQFFKARTGRTMVFLRFFFAWLILFGSKFVILEALAAVFGEKVKFTGMFHGMPALILVVVTMLVAEEAVARLYRHLK